MNVNRLYIARIYVNSGLFDLRWYSKFIKTAIVYSMKNCYVDLFIKEKYMKGINNSLTGDLFVEHRCGLIPLYDNFNVSFEKENMSRKKIIRTLAKSELLNKKEDDK